jgi:hypothetical protein
MSDAAVRRFRARDRAERLFQDQRILPEVVIN